MVDFTEKLRLRGKAEEDLYFAALDRELIEAMHQRQANELLEHAAQEQSYDETKQK
jgi:hypothetical protein